MPDATPRFAFAPLDGKRHDRAAFSSGEASLDEYLKRRAAQDQQRRVAVTHVMTHAGNPAASRTICAYYTLSSAAIALTELPLAYAKRLPGYPQIGVALLGRLAVDQRFHGQGLGGVALKDALARSLALSDTQLGIQAVVVDALHDSARHFYEHYGFVTLPGHPMRLYLPMETIRRLG